MEVETDTKCKRGYFEWFLTREISYDEKTGKPQYSTNEPVAEKYIPWMSGNISYCLASILFQIRDDEEPYDKDIAEMFESIGNTGEDIRLYSLIKPELEFCKCDTWSEEDHTEFCEAIDEFASLGLKMHIWFDYKGCTCKIPNDYEIPKMKMKHMIDWRRWEIRK